MSFFSFLTKKNHGTSLVLDIGSGSVGGALIAKGSEAPLILYSIRIPIAVSKKNTEGRLFQGMIKATEEVLKSLIHEAHALHAGRIHSATCFLSSPWYVSRVHTSNIERPDPVTVTENFLDDVLVREAKDFTIVLKQQEKEQILTGKVVIMENKTLSVALNGYKVNNPYGKQARNIEVTSYVSLISSELKQKLENLVNTFTHINDLSLLSFPVGLHSFIEKYFPHEENYMLFDITAEMTDMAIVEDGNISHTEAFAQGRNTLIRKVSEAFDVGPDLALSFIHLYAEKKMEPVLQERMEKIVLDVRSEWEKGFADLLQGKSRRSFPRKVFITADEGVGKVFVDFLSKNSIVKSEGDVIMLGGFILANMTHVQGNSTDPFLLVESSHIHSSY